MQLANGTDDVGVWGWWAGLTSASQLCWGL